MSQHVTTELPAEDVAAIRRVADDFVRLIIVQDFEALARLYCEDAVLLPPNQPAVRGRPAIKEWMRSFPKVTEFKFDIEKIEGRADLAYVRGKFRMALHPEGAPGQIEEAGKYIEIRRRQPDGSWPIANDIFNSDK